MTELAVPFTLRKSTNKPLRERRTAVNELIVNMKKSMNLYLLLLTLLFSGCATMSKYDDARYFNGRIYPFEATMSDTGMIYDIIARGKPEGVKPDAFDFLYSPYMIPFYIIDIPFSIVADIITLPFDLIYAGDKWDKENSKPIGNSAPSRDQI